MRTIFANEIAELAKTNPRIIVLTGDFGYKLFGWMENEPTRYINCGCAEQSMVGVAAGLAMQGYLPIVCAITPFLIRRTYEQIYLDVVCQKLKVVFMGYSDYPTAGPTHQADDCDLLCQAVKLPCIYPGDEENLRWLVRTLLADNKPYFFNLRNKSHWSK